VLLAPKGGVSALDKRRASGVSFKSGSVCAGTEPRTGEVVCQQLTPSIISACAVMTI